MTLETLLSDFHRLSGHSIAIVDPQLRTILMESGDRVGFCTSIHRSGRCLRSCLESDKEATRRVRESGEDCLYTCPFGLTEGLFPIREGEQVIGCFFVVLGIARDEDRALPLRRYEEISGEAADEPLRALAKALPCDSPEHRASVVRLLTVMGEYIGQHHLLDTSTVPLGEMIRRYIERNLAGTVTLGELSKSLHRSTVTLTEAFRREFGESIMQYTARRRMECAKELLKGSTLPLGEIAARCGYRDAAYFSRVFRQCTGVSPSAWRKAQGLLKRSE